MKPNHYRHCPGDCAAEHQPRERAVPCHVCGRPTVEVAGACGDCIERIYGTAVA
jgi:hypothetical protein